MHRYVLDRLQGLHTIGMDGENLLYPVYGTLKQKSANWFGFFGLTEHYLLISLLKGNSKEISWTTRVPLHIKKVTIKNRLFSLMYNVDIEFFDGEAGHFLISKKVRGIESQEKNISGFIDYIQTYQIGICEVHMYTIKTADFSLEFIPGVNSISIEVHCDDFSGRTRFDTEDFLIADFALQLKELYEKLEGSAKIQDLYETDSYIEFSAQRFGHILIKGILIHNTQQLTFEYDVDQTYLHKFVAELVADYSKYVE